MCISVHKKKNIVDSILSYRTAIFTICNIKLITRKVRNHYNSVQQHKQHKINKNAQKNSTMLTITTSALRLYTSRRCLDVPIFILYRL